MTSYEDDVLQRQLQRLSKCNFDLEPFDLYPSMRIVPSSDYDEFLTGKDIPPNLLRLKEGEVLAWNREPRYVIRTGYRLRSSDFMKEAAILLNQDPVISQANRAICRALGVGHISKLQQSIARTLAAKAGLGGPHRGVVVHPYKTNSQMKVVSTRIVNVGVYFPPSGYGEDYEGGGLAQRMSVVLVTLDDGYEVLSGDLVRVGKKTKHKVAPA